MSGIPYYRWSDHDHRLGRFIYARERNYRPIEIALTSKGDDEEEQAFCTLRLRAFGHTLIVLLPQIVKPYRTKVYPGAAWNAETVARLGRDWYWNVEPREYSISVNEGFLSVHYGRSTHDSSTDQSWGYFLPWMDWRHVRHSWYGFGGEHIADMPQVRTYAGMSTEEHRGHWAEQERVEALAPTVAFDFRDFDGEPLIATTKIEEREWRRGTGWWKWLSLVWPKKVRRSLSISFSGETGKRKGSWKGGTIGTGVDMLPGELHEAAFRRYCAENSMTFLARETAHV